MINVTAILLLGVFAMDVWMVTAAQAESPDEHKLRFAHISGLRLSSAATQGSPDRPLSHIALAPGKADAKGLTMALQIEDRRVAEIDQGGHFLDPLDDPTMAAPQNMGLDYTGEGKIGLNTYLIYSPLTSTHVGLSLKSAIAPSQGGRSALHGRTTRLRGANVGFPVAIEGIALEAEHQLNDQWTLLGNLAWIRSQAEAGSSLMPIPDVIVPVVWDETTRYVLGVIFMPADRWSVRAKVSLDRPFLGKAAKETEAVPDHGRLWIAAGVDYRVQKDFSFKLEYTRLTIMDGSPFTHDPPDSLPLHDEAGAERALSVDVISAMLKIQF